MFESRVDRIPTAGLIASPDNGLRSAPDAFENPATRVNETRQTEFRHFRAIHWARCFRSLVSECFARYMIAWKHGPTMGASDAIETLGQAIAGIDPGRAQYRARLPSVAVPISRSTVVLPMLSVRYYARL